MAGLTDDVFDDMKSWAGTERDCRQVPFPVASQNILYSRYSKRDISYAMGSSAPVKLPMTAFWATQSRVSPIGVERFVLLALAGILVPLPRVIHCVGYHLICEGHHRLTALHDLGADEVEVQLTDMGGCLWK